MSRRTGRDGGTSFRTRRGNHHSAARSPPGQQPTWMAARSSRAVPTMRTRQCGQRTMPGISRGFQRVRANVAAVAARACSMASAVAASRSRITASCTAGREDERGADGGGGEGTARMARRSSEAVFARQAPASGRRQAAGAFRRRATATACGMTRWPRCPGFETAPSAMPMSASGTSTSRSPTRHRRPPSRSSMAWTSWMMVGVFMPEGCGATLPHCQSRRAGSGSSRPRRLELPDVSGTARPAAMRALS